MIPISNEDARVILALLERVPTFYADHAVKPADMNDARLMKKMSKRLKQHINLAAGQPRPKNNKQQ